MASPFKTRSGLKFGISPKKPALRSVRNILGEEKGNNNNNFGMAGSYTGETTTVQMPMFDGMRTNDVDEWLRKLATYMTFKKFGEADKLSVMVLCLTGAAKDLWEVETDTIMGMQGTVNVKFNAFVVKLRNTFGKVNGDFHKRRMFDAAEIAAGDTVTGWILKVKVMAKKCGVVDEEVIKARIINGLPEEVARKFLHIQGEDLSDWETHGKLLDEKYDFSGKLQEEETNINYLELMEERMEQQMADFNAQMDQLAANVVNFSKREEETSSDMVLNLEIKQLREQVERLSRNNGNNGYRNDDRYRSDDGYRRDERRDGYRNRYGDQRREDDERYAAERRKNMARWYTDGGEPICIICEKVGHRTNECEQERLPTKEYLEKLKTGPKPQIQSRNVQIKEKVENINTYNVNLDKENSLKIDVKINDKNVIALVDSGATHTLIHADSSPKDVELHLFKGVGKGAGGSLRIFGYFMANIKIGKQSFEHKMIVTDSIDTDMGSHII